MEHTPGTRQAVRVTIFTPQLRIMGAVRLHPFRRLTDVLNQQAEQFMRLSDAEIAPSHWGRHLHDTTTDEVCVNKEEIILAFPVLHDVTRDEALYVKKVPRRVGIYTPVIRMMATLHCLWEVPISETLESSRQPFLALTDVELFSLDGNNRSLLMLPFLNLHRRYVTALYEDYEGDDEESPDNSA